MQSSYAKLLLGSIIFHMKNSFIPFLCVAFLVFPLYGDPQWTDSAQLSPAGIRRVQENAEILKKSIETTKRNIQNSEQNVSTLDGELLELQRLEEEVVKLKNQYEAFLSQANQESQKNKEVLGGLSRMTDRKLAELEKEDRQNWQRNTEQQMTQVKDLLNKLNKDWVKLSNRRKELNTQKESWISRGKAHQQLLEDLNSKKAAAEKKLKGEG